MNLFFRLDQMQQKIQFLCETDRNHILRKTIEGYLDSVPSLTFNTIKTKLSMHAFHCSRYLKSKWMFDFSHASIIKVQYMSKWWNLYTEKSQAFKNDWNPFLSSVSHNGWLQNHCWLPAIGMTPYFVIFICVLLQICCHIGWDMPYLCIFVEEFVTLLDAITD